METLLTLIKLSLLNKYFKTCRLIVVCTFLFNGHLICQTNLIQNGSFEFYNNVANFNTGDGLFFDYSVVPEQRIVLNWNVFSSPDYYSTAYTYTYTYKGVPTNMFGSIYPKQGNAYAGIYTFLKSSEVKEYIYQQLPETLKTDSTYCLSFFVSKADRTNYSMSKLGAFFSTNMPNTNANGYINATPQVLNSVGLNDTIGWTEIKGCFIAQGGEEYITVGNFNSNFSTDTVYTGTSNPFPSGGSNNSYYYIDSVSLYKNNFPTGIINTGNKDFGFNVYPNPASNFINISLLDNNAHNNLSMKIVDVLGKEMFVDKCKKEIDISFLEKGIYFLSLFDNNGLVATKKIIKE